MKGIYKGLDSLDSNTESDLYMITFDKLESALGKKIRCHFCLEYIKQFDMHAFCALCMDVIYCSDECAQFHDYVHSKHKDVKPLLFSPVHKKRILDLKIRYDKPDSSFEIYFRSKTGNIISALSVPPAFIDRWPDLKRYRDNTALNSGDMNVREELVYSFCYLLSQGCDCVRTTFRSRGKREIIMIKPPSLVKFKSMILLLQSTCSRSTARDNRLLFKRLTDLPRGDYPKELEEYYLSYDIDSEFVIFFVLPTKNRNVFCKYAAKLKITVPGKWNEHDHCFFPQSVKTDIESIIYVVMKQQVPSLSDMPTKLLGDIFNQISLLHEIRDTKTTRIHNC